MTEKRFSMKGSTILENNEEITAWDCCDLLNELHEENQKLLTLSNMKKGALVEAVKDLIKENEQLKQTIETQNFNYGNAKSTIYNSEKQIRNLKQENEQLKGEVAHYKLILMSLEQQAKRISSIRSCRND